VTEHPTKQELEDYRWRVLAPAAFLSVHRHVAGCQQCAAECNQPQDLARDLDDLRTALLDAGDGKIYHLSAQEALLYARGELGEIDSEIAVSHLSSCATCLSEVQRYTRARSAFVNRWQPWRVAAVVSCAVLLILLAVWLFRTKPTQNKEQVRTPTNQTSPQSSPATIEQGSNTPEVEVNQFALVLNDGNQKITVDKQGKLAGLEQLPSATQQKIRAALLTGKLERSPALAQLSSRSSILLSESGNGLPFRLIGPLGLVVRSEQPTLRWHALEGAQSYQVIVTDADLNEVAASPTLNTTEWRISEPLKAGRIYSWQVSAMKDGAKITSPVLPAPQAKFKVLDRATAEVLLKAERAYPESHLTLGVLYAEAGLLDDAEQQLRLFISNNPRNDIAQKLLQNVTAMRAAH
jgi:hypothetical protein